MIETNIGIEFSNYYATPSNMISFIISQWLDEIFCLDYLLKIEIPVIETVFLIMTPFGISGLRVFSIFGSSN
jgi:hypothetical protein